MNLHSAKNAVVLKRKSDGEVVIVAVDDPYPAAVSDDAFEGFDVLLVIAPDGRLYKDSKEVRVST